MHSYKATKAFTKEARFEDWDLGLAGANLAYRAGVLSSKMLTSCDISPRNKEVATDNALDYVRRRKENIRKAFNIVTSTVGTKIRVDSLTRNSSWSKDPLCEVEVLSPERYLDNLPIRQDATLERSSADWWRR